MSLQVAGLIIVVCGLALMLFSIIQAIRGGVRDSMKELRLIKSSGYVTEHTTPNRKDLVFREKIVSQTDRTSKPRIMSASAKSLFAEVESQRAREKMEHESEKKDKETAVRSIKPGTTHISTAGSSDKTGVLMTDAAATDVLMPNEATDVLPSVDGTDLLSTGEATDILTIDAETTDVLTSNEETDVLPSADETDLLSTGEATDILTIDAETTDVLMSSEATDVLPSTDETDVLTLANADKDTTEVLLPEATTDILDQTDILDANIIGR